MSTKTHRLVMRATDEQVKAIWHAAELEGVLPSEFIRRAAVERAHEVIERYHVIKVTLEQGERMMAALDRKGEDDVEH